MPQGISCVMLDEKQLSLEDIRFLKCVAAAVHCPCDMEKRNGLAGSKVDW
jgi:hypothetical protein